MLGHLDCGCDTRKETLGVEHFWTGVTIAGAILLLAFTRGGTVTNTTKQILKIGAAGALVAILADAVVNPAVKG